MYNLRKTTFQHQLVNWAGGKKREQLKQQPVCSWRNVFPELFATSQPKSTAVKGSQLSQRPKLKNKTPTFSVAFFWALFLYLQKQDVIFQNVPDD